MQLLLNKFSEVWHKRKIVLEKKNNIPHPEFEFNKVSLFAYQQNHFSLPFVYKTQP